MFHTLGGTSPHQTIVDLIVGNHPNWESTLIRGKLRNTLRQQGLLRGVHKTRAALNIEMLLPEQSHEVFSKSSPFS
jgi:hypothetical protein